MAMIKINLKNNYKTVQEGERVLEITDAKATPSGKPNKLQLNMRDVEDGATLINSYKFDNDTSVWAMGVMLNKALGLEDGDDFDTNNVSQLIGVKLLCEVTRSEYNGKTYANVRKVIEKVENATTNEVNTEIDVDFINNTLYSRSSLEETDDLS
jgi:hypothetical protein